MIGMLCARCQKNEARIHLQLQVNHEKKVMDVCPECYAAIRKESMKGVFSSHGSLFDQWMPGAFNYSLFSSSQESQDIPEQGGGCSLAQPAKEEKSVLKQYGRNLTQIAKTGLIDPVIGRDFEIEQVIEILNRRNKNNPVLIGEPGVGKTAIAEGLALRIAEGNVPAKLLNKEVISLDVASLTSGTSYRGQFEERMKQLIKELQAEKNKILFIDEIHQLVGAGKTEGSMDAGNILKPALARGKLQVVGATTLKEYRSIEKDAALERRFQPIMVKEPSVEDTIQILKGLRPKYEAYHHVTYPDEVLEACATLSHRYIQDRHLPDKAIDLLDEAGSKVNLRSHQDDADKLRKRLAEIAAEKQAAAAKEDYEQAARLRQEEILLEAKIEKLEKDEVSGKVSVEDIQVLIENKTGIPVRKLQAAEQEKLKNLAERLNTKVIGQKEAVDRVAKAVRRSRAGFHSGNRPIASFLFVGPTGVGKTELTRCLAEEIFGDRNATVRLDMSEYMEKHTVSKLIGSPPGYVGHEEAGQLTEQIRRKPYSILLLDEMEKAHPDVQNMFLQVLEDGRLTDSQGRTVSFKDTIVIMTTNAKVLADHYRPEFLNRIDAIVSFNSLDKEHLLQIVDLMLNDLRQNLSKQKVTLTVSDEVKVKLAELGYDPAFGARPLRRVIQEQLEDPIVDLLLDETSVEAVSAELVDGQIQVSKTK